MTVTKGDEGRRIVPRWRSSKEMTRSHEAMSFGEEPKEFSRNELTREIEKWRHTKADEDALEVLFASMVVGDDTDGQDAIQQLAVPEKRLRSLVSESALRALLGQTGECAKGEAYTDRHSRIAEAADLKKKLSFAPRNPLLWADYSRVLLTLGASEKAQRLMRVALSLAPESRYLARSAVRMLVHNNEPDHAKWFIESRQRVRTDPWLLSAELAVSSILGRTSQHTKIAKSLASQASPDDPNFSELFSALSTVFFEGGAIKLAKRYFHKSLIQPTDNSLAQAEWLSKQIGGLQVPDQFFDLPSSFEAKAQHYARNSEWGKMIQECHGWCDDEPFSARAPLTASYVSALATGDSRLCQTFSEVGLIANPNDGALLNNFAVSLAQQGKLTEAREVLERRLLKSYRSDDIHILCLNALLGYRSGKPDEGRALYERAIDQAVKKKDQHLAALALLHECQEEMVAGTERAQNLFDMIVPVIKKIEQPEIQAMLSRLRTYRDFAQQAHQQLDERAANKSF